MKILMKGRHFIIRSFFSSALGELVMLVLWVTIAFSGKINTTQLIQLAASDYSVRIGYLIIFAIPAAFIVKFFKSFDQVDIYDVSTNFNPFNLSLENEIKHSHEKQATKK